jgi:hypothetical protein
MAEHPFVPGARVAVSIRFSDEVRESFVDKVYKSGNFTLRGSNQQWRPWCSDWSDKRWHATATGSGWDRGSLQLWDETTDAEISARVAATNLKNRWRAIRQKVDNLKTPTIELCDAIETALNGVPTCS